MTGIIVLFGLANAFVCLYLYERRKRTTAVGAPMNHFNYGSTPESRLYSSRHDVPSINIAANSLAEKTAQESISETIKT